MGKCGAGLALAITACLTGCGPSVECSDPEAQALVEQLFQEKVYPLTAYQAQPQMHARYEELADAKYEISDIVTVRRPTESNPAAMCKAKLEHSLYRVYLDPEKEGRVEAEATAARREIQQSATGRESPSELADRFAAISKRREAFQSNPDNLVRSDERMALTNKFTYTVSQTDDGRLYVEIQPDDRR